MASSPYVAIMKNEDLINDFVRFLALNEIHELRQKKYKYALTKISKILNKNFFKADKKDIEDLITKIENNGYAGWTKHDYRVVVKKFYTWLYNKDNEDIDNWEIPSIIKWIKIKKPDNKNKLPSELITPKDIQFLLEYCKNLREKAFILTLYECGGRIGELLNLKLEDIISDDYGVILNLFGKTGYRKVRLIGSAPAISEWIANEHPKRNDKESYLFCNTYDKPGGKLSYTSAYKILKKLKERSGFKKDINPHLFRHSRATELSEYLTDAQRCNYFGWQQGSQVCRIYTHLQDTDRAILELNGLIRKEKGKDGKFSNIVCPRCNTNNPYGSEICAKCNLVFNPSNIEKYEKRDQLIKKLLDPKELDNLISDKILEKLKEREKQSIK